MHLLNPEVFGQEAEKSCSKKQYYNDYPDNCEKCL
jgi:hypothetical protein